MLFLSLMETPHRIQNRRTPQKLASPDSDAVSPDQVQEDQRNSRNNVGERTATALFPMPDTEEHCAVRSALFNTQVTTPRVVVSSSSPWLNHVAAAPILSRRQLGSTITQQ